MPHREKKRLCFRGLFIDIREVYQYVCRLGRAEEHEI